MELQVKINSSVMYTSTLPLPTHAHLQALSAPSSASLSIVDFMLPANGSLHGERLLSSTKNSEDGFLVCQVLSAWSFCSGSRSKISSSRAHGKSSSLEIVYEKEKIAFFSQENKISSRKKNRKQSYSILFHSTHRQSS